MSVAAVGILAAALQGLTLWVLTGIRDDMRALVSRVSEHESFIAALKMQEALGGYNGKRS